MDLEIKILYYTLYDIQYNILSILSKNVIL